MRLSVVDVGSNTVRLMVADAEDGMPLPVHTAKWKLRLSEHVDAEGRLAEESVGRLVKAVAAAGETAQRWGAAGPLAFATAVVRNAPNRGEVLRAVRAGTGVQICTLPGEVEAELTFLGARRWMGWQAGPLDLFDISGGSLEVAFGRGRLPDFVASLPLGANRLTREFFQGEDPPSARSVHALRRRVRHQLRDVAGRIRWEGPRTTVATSRTFQQLGRLCGAAPGREGPFVPRQLARCDLRSCIDSLAALPAAERARLPGISAPRARQSLAGAVVGHTVMKLSGIKTAEISPWAIREGVLLRYIEDAAAWWSAVADGGEDTVPSGRVPLRIATRAGSLRARTGVCGAAYRVRLTRYVRAATGRRGVRGGCDLRLSMARRAVAAPPPPPRRTRSRGGGLSGPRRLLTSVWVGRLSQAPARGREAIACGQGDAGQADVMRPPQGPGPRRGEMPGDPQRENPEQPGPLPGLPTIEQAELLYEETEQLKEALERRPVIDVARGVLMATWSCTEEEAWQMLVRVSQHSNTKLHDVAEAVVAATQRQPMPADLQDHLAAAVAVWRARRAGEA